MFSGRCFAVSLTPSLIVAALVSPALAQWTADPVTNTPIVTAGGEQVQPKIVPTSDGGAYISWFDNRAGGYDVYLQRINAAGEALWQRDGVLIADRSFGSTQDYDLAVDADDHAIVAFRDDRFGGIVVTASRVSPDGTQVWGPLGVQPTMTGSFVGAIRATVTSDGNIAVGWFNGSAAYIVKLDQEGNELWTQTIGDAPVGSFTVSDLIASDGLGESGEMIVVMTTFGSFITPRHIYAQKLDAGGNTLWTNPTPIHTGPSIQVGNFPRGEADGAGGMVIAWYQLDPLQVRAQRLNATGQSQFPAGGAVVSTNASQLRVEPGAAFNHSNGETFVFWRELDSFQNSIGIYGQKFDASGARQWTNNGLPILTTSNESTQVVAIESGDGAQVFFVERLSPSAQRVRGARLDDDGAFIWDDELVNIATASSQKSRLTAIQSSGGDAFLVWEDSRNGLNDLFAQNISADGALGPPEGVPGDLDGNGSVGVPDLLLLLAAWGQCPAEGACPADLDENGTVGVPDLLILLANWG